MTLLQRALEENIGDALHHSGRLSAGSPPGTRPGAPPPPSAGSGGADELRDRFQQLCVVLRILAAV